MSALAKNYNRKKIAFKNGDNDYKIVSLAGGIYFSENGTQQHLIGYDASEDYFVHKNASNTVLMVVSSSGWVGIGTSAANGGEIFTVQNSATRAQVRFGGDNDAGGRIGFDYNGDSSYIDVYGGHGSTARYRDFEIDARKLKLFSRENDDVILGQGGNEHMAVRGSGKVHISSSAAIVGSSTASLHVEGSGSEVVAVDGTNGRLFSVTDEISGSIFSANTVAGIPVIEATSAYEVKLDPFGNGQLLFGNCAATADKSFNFHADVNGVIMDIVNPNTGNPKILDMSFSGEAPDDNTSYYLRGTDTSADRVVIWADGDVNNADNAYGSISDVRIKQGIRDANSQWNDIKAVKVRNFKKNEDVEQYGDNAWEQIGVIAQELEASGMDKLIKEHPASKNEATSGDGSFKEGDMIKSVSYSVLYMKAIKALQEAMTRIETLEAQMAQVSGSS